MRVVLGVPTLNRYDLLADLVASARASSRPPDEIVIVDNGGTLAMEQVTIMRPGRNVGVGPAWNMIARAAFHGRDDRLLLVGDDVRLATDAIEVLLRTHEQTGADMVYPGHLAGNIFSCFMCTPMLFGRVGYFDEDFAPAYFEDNDFHYRMRLCGVKDAAAPCVVAHQGSATLARFSAAQLEEHHRNFERLRQLYVRKWGGVPGSEAYITPYNKG